MRGLHTRAAFGYSIVGLHVQPGGPVLFPLNTSSFQSLTRKAIIVFQMCLCVCVCCMLAGTLLVCVPCMLRKAEEGHSATGSLRVHRVERKQALVSERLATSCSEARVYRGHCLSSGYPVSNFTV